MSLKVQGPVRTNYNPQIPHLDWYDECASSSAGQASQYMSVDRKKTRVFRSLKEADDGGFMPGTPAERLSQVWELTREVWSFMDPARVEQRLQRDVAVLKRRGG